MTKTKIKISGVGIHSGAPSEAVIDTAPSGGIRFVRNGVEAPALYGNVSATGLRNTTVGRAPNQIETIEHLMCALFVTGVMNAKIGISGAEVPILDGSAAEFIAALKKLEPAGKIPIFRIRKEVIVRQSEIAMPLWLRIFNFLRGRRRDGYVRLSPTRKNGLEITARLIYKYAASSTSPMLPRISSRAWLS